MRLHRTLTILILLLGALLSLPCAEAAKYNPAKDNPYIHIDQSQNKKWYEIFKKEKTSPYVSKNSGYWYSTKQENALVRGVKSVFGGLRDTAKTVLS